ncbi:AvrD family protein [Amycolatopsis sp. cmx-4-61]|uniref:AvrD family protein n=1 Tax=Amycolatopsis sp. cmx-4-61 TaxID=2790937 RepID=UPI00397E4D92
MHVARSSTTSPVPRSPRRFASIDDQLGPHSQRYFGSGFKRVTHRITGAHLDPSTDLLRARAHLNYPTDWSAKTAGKQLTPHLSTLDAAVVAVQLAELHLNTAFELGDQQRRALWIRRLSIKAGATPQEQLDDVALSVRRTSTERNAATGVSRMEGRVGALATVCEVVHDRDLRIARQTSDAIDTDEILGDPARRYFGQGFQQRNYDLRDVVIADDHSAVSATTRVSGDVIHPDGLSGKFQPAITFVDGLIVLAQLAQSLLYALDDIDRTASNTLWMRRVEISGPPPHQRLGAPFRSSTSVSRTALVDFAGGRWRTSDWRAQFSGLTFSYRLAHDIPAPRDAR